MSPGRRRLGGHLSSRRAGSRHSLDQAEWGVPADQPVNSTEAPERPHVKAEMRADAQGVKIPSEQNESPRAEDKEIQAPEYAMFSSPGVNKKHWTRTKAGGIPATGKRAHSNRPGERR